MMTIKQKKEEEQRVLYNKIVSAVGESLFAPVTRGGKRYDFVEEFTKRGESIVNIKAVKKEIVALLQPKDILSGALTDLSDTSVINK